jgi:hypothetical protein
MRGKTVVITGGTSCIAEVVGEKFAQMGARNLEIASPRGICVKTKSSIAKWLNNFRINWEATGSCALLRLCSGRPRCEPIKEYSDGRRDLRVGLMVSDAGAVQ